MRAGRRSPTLFLHRTSIPRRTTSDVSEGRTETVASGSPRVLSTSRIASLSHRFFFPYSRTTFPSGSLSSGEPILTSLRSVVMRSFTELRSADGRFCMLWLTSLAKASHSRLRPVSPCMVLFSVFMAALPILLTRLIRTSVRNSWAFSGASRKTSSVSASPLLFSAIYGRYETFVRSILTLQASYTSNCREFYG